MIASLRSLVHGDIMNWQKIDRKAMHELAEKGGYTGKARKNLWTLFKEIKNMGFEGLFNVQCVCICGREHAMIMAVKDFEGAIREKRKNDEKPKVMCPHCTNLSMEMMQQGIDDPKFIADLLGWKEGDRFDRLPGQAPGGVAG